MALPLALPTYTRHVCSFCALQSTLKTPSLNSNMLSGNRWLHPWPCPYCGTVDILDTFQLLVDFQSNPLAQE